MSKNYFLLLLLAIGSSFSVQAQKKHLPPPAVLSAFQQQFPDARDVDWDREKNGIWEAEFERNGQESSAAFSAAGQWLETETEIDRTELPVAVQMAIHGRKVKEAARVLRPNGVSFFEVEIKGKDLHYDANGALLREEADDDNGQP